jgi:predicted N-acetyltransferase YhbS
MFELRKQRPQDAVSVEVMLDDAFGPGRFARTAYRLREMSGTLDHLSLVAESADKLVGAIGFAPIRIGRGKALLLGPLVVSPKAQGQGAGLALLEKGLSSAIEEAVDMILLIGDAPYYGRVGFEHIERGRVRMPGPVDPNRLLGLEVKSSALATVEGKVRPGW